ncbi:MAG: acyltransferase [Bacillota bacterium]|nr:acyltransferase [Bacillota bacterium]
MDKLPAGPRARITSVELMRFIAAIAVMIFHFFTVYINSDGLVVFAYVFVDFFFVLSGFFMMKHLTEKKEPLNPAAFLLHKVRSFYPIFITAFALQFLLFVEMNRLFSFREALGALRHFKWEALLLQTTHFIPDPQFNTDYLLGQAWYLSAMMLALVFAYPLAKYMRKWFLALICPLAILLIYSYAMEALGTMNIGNEYFGVISSAVLRGFAGTCVGSLCYAGYGYLKDHHVKGRKVASAIEILCYLGVLVLIFLPGGISDADSLFFVLVFGLIIIFSFLDETPVSHFLNTHGTGVLSWLGSISLYLYLLHWSVMTGLNLWGKGLDPALAVALYFAITLALSIILKYINEKRKTALPIALIAGLLIIAAFVLAVLQTG